MEEYPRNLAEFERRFATEEACRAYLEQLRWSEGFRCPRCDGTKAWRVRQRWWQCVGCAHQTSVTAGTIFQDTRSPLPTWFRAMWWVTNQKSGLSALGLQRALGSTLDTTPYPVGLDAPPAALIRSETSWRRPTTALSTASYSTCTGNSMGTYSTPSSSKHSGGSFRSSGPSPRRAPHRSRWFGTPGLTARPWAASGCVRDSTCGPKSLRSRTA